MSDDFDNLHGLPPWARWVLKPCQVFVAIAGVIGFFAFIAFAITFFLAFRSGTAGPTAERPRQLRDHADVAYVTTTQYRVTEFFKIVSLIGLGIGVPGYIAVQALARGLRKRYACQKPLLAGSGMVGIAREKAAADIIQP